MIQIICVPDGKSRMAIHDAEIAGFHGYGKALANLFCDFLATRA
jgi:hypothetical protein